MSKNIFVSNSGSYLASPASYDDNSALSSSAKISANTASFAGQSGILQIKNKQLVPVAVGALADSGSVLTYVSGSGLILSNAGLPSLTGDISGNNISGVMVRNVSNVSSGILSSSVGGLNTSSYTAGSIITTSGSGPVYGAVDKVVAVIDSAGTWGLSDSNILNFTPMTGGVVYLYTGSVGTSNTFTWTKPNGCRTIRVICQGGGGGGASGYYGASNLICAGAGGSGGGTSDITLNAFTLPNSVQIVAGSGGQGASSRGFTTPPSAGTSGGSSSFGAYISAGGGIGGTAGTAASVAGVGGTYGYSKTGGSSSGAAYNTNGNAGGNNTLIGYPGGGSGGGRGIYNGGAGGSITFAGLQIAVQGPSGGIAINGGSTITSEVYGKPSNNQYLINPQNYFLNNTASSGEFPKLLSSGGSGGGSWNTPSATMPVLDACKGGSAAFGAGGGSGGYISTTSSRGASATGGGDGGKGYVLIICY